MTGNAIKQERQAAGVTQEQLARSLSLSVFTVAQWEQGRRQPSLSDAAIRAGLLRARRALVVAQERKGRGVTPLSPGPEAGRAPVERVHGEDDK